MENNHISDDKFHDLHKYMSYT